MADGGESSSSGYGALNATRYLPTRSRGWEELVLQTYGEGSDPLQAGDDGTARLVFNDGRGSLQWHSGSKVSFDSGGAGGGSSSKRWINAGSLCKADRRSRFARRQLLSFGLNSHEIRHYLEGFLYRVVGGKDPNNFLVRIEFIWSKIYEIDQRGLNRFSKCYCFGYELRSGLNPNVLDLLLLGRTWR
jgi:hypothetical protein